jgi:uncharacterized phage protein (TIGR02220 family)
MIKKTKRKAFNFLRSYFDVLNELTNDKDKLDFLTAIINKQFLNEDPIELNFIVNLCYESQRHQIETSVKGWLRATKEELSPTLQTTPMTTPMTTTMTTTMTSGKEEEEEEEEKVKEDDKSSIDYDKLLKYINLTFDKKFQKVNDKAKKQFKARLKDYSKDVFKIVIDNLKNDEYHKETSYKFITPEYISREKTVELHSHKLNNEVIQDDYYLNIMKKLNQQ